MRRGTPLTDKMRAAMKAYAADRKFRLAVSVGIAPSTYSGWASGAYFPTVTDDRVLRLAQVLGVPREEVFTRNEAAGQPPPHSAI